MNTELKELQIGLPSFNFYVFLEKHRNNFFVVVLMNTIKREEVTPNMDILRNNLVKFNLFCSIYGTSE